MERTVVTQTQIVNQLLKIGHGDLSIYKDTGLKAANYEPELFAHMIAWNDKKGEIRDSKVALPILALRGKFDGEYFENAVAHLLKLPARDLLRACQFHKELVHPVTPGGGSLLKEGVRRYIKEREASNKWWNATALQHRKSLKALYAVFHIKPSRRAQDILFNKKGIGVFGVVKELKNMTPQEAAGAIMTRKIPFLVAVGALGGIKDKPDVIMALMERMSGNELINNTGMLQRMGVFDSPILKSAWEKAVEDTKKDKRTSTIKAHKASKKVKGKAAKKLEQVDESKRAQMGGIEGDWLVLGDCSGSMQQSVKMARDIAALIADQVKGTVHLIFFNTDPKHYNVTGKTLGEIEQMTRGIRAYGGTAVGCGIEYLRQKGIVVNGIALISDGGDNRSPSFGRQYQKYAADIGIEPPVYFYRVLGDFDRLDRNVAPMIEFDIDRNFDYYSLPNLVNSMKTSKYKLVDEIMEVPLLTINDVFKKHRTM